MNEIFNQEILLFSNGLMKMLPNYNFYFIGNANV